MLGLRHVNPYRALTAIPFPHAPGADQVRQSLAWWDDELDAVGRTLGAIRGLPTHDCDGHASGVIRRRGDGRYDRELVCDVCHEPVGSLGPAAVVRGQWA